MAVIQGENGLAPRHSWNDFPFASGVLFAASMPWLPRIEMRCAKAKIRLQTEGGIRSPPTGKDAITTADAGSKRTIEGELGVCHRRPPEAKGLVLTILSAGFPTMGGLNAEIPIEC